MHSAAAAVAATLTLSITKTVAQAPAFRIGGLDTLYVHNGLVVDHGGLHAVFADGTAVVMPAHMSPGTDYEIALNPDATLSAHACGAAVAFGRPVVGGFHYAPFSNAAGRAGGDAVPSINPYSIYDHNWRPACPNPRGMALVDGRFWADIYLLGTNHKSEGTSRWGARIADGRSLDRLNYADAVAIMESHGKALLGVTDFWAAAYGVKEKAAREEEPDNTGTLTDADIAFTSKYGLMQTTGCMWQWGHDEDPDEPRASLLGGSWVYGSYAGSRYADRDYWPERSDGHVGARGRSDHLNHG